MSLKEIKNLFGEVLSDEIESKVVKNKTLAFKKKSKATKEYHYIPIKNIKHRKETKQFLQKTLWLLEKYSIDQIIYALGLELTGGKHLPDYQKSKSDLTITIPEKVREEHDLIGDCYQYLNNKHERLKKGSFYTTESIVEKIIKNIYINENTSLFDPACGSGNLILNSKVKNPEQVHGMDIDPIAVMCCQFNYYLKFGNAAPEPDIKCYDFADFVKSNGGEIKYDVILCNPPYGAEMVIDMRDSEVQSIDCLDYFVEHCSKMAETSIFVLPETVINVKKHERLRAWILQNNKLTAIQSFGASIAGTLYNIVALTLDQKENNNYFFDGKKVDYDFTINRLDGKFRPIGQEDIEFINKIYRVKHQTLEKSKHVTGIVTGDDEKFLLDSPTENSEPILTGKNIEPYCITGEKYINYSDVRNQLAIAVRDSYFRTKEKLIYHTVSRYLEFAIDTESRLTTCTANFFLVRNVDMSVKCIMALFNSKIYNRLNKLLFGDKVNRGCNIKKLPIPIIYKEKQLEIERCVDEKDYERIENILKEIFDI